MCVAVAKLRVLSIVSLISHSMDQVEGERDSYPRITTKWLKDQCRKHGLYQTARLNEVLYLQHQGFQRIEGLDDYTGLRSLWFDHNLISRIDCGLQHMIHLKCLFLQNNCLVSLGGIDRLEQLVILDVSHNQLHDTRYLDGLANLNTLYIGHNKLRDASEIENLANSASLITLDLSCNQLHQARPLISIVERMPQLRVFYLNGNPVVRDIDPYRITITLHCQNLTFLDDRPVRELDRACANAWAQSGREGVDRVKIQWQEREHQEMMSNVHGVLKLGKKWQTQIQEEDLNVAPSLDLGSIQLDLMDCQERDPTVILNDPTEMNELVTLASRSTSD